MGAEAEAECRLLLHRNPNRGRPNHIPTLVAVDEILPLRAGRPNRNPVEANHHRRPNHPRLVAKVTGAGEAVERRPHHLLRRPKAKAAAVAAVVVTPV